MLQLQGDIQGINARLEAAVKTNDPAADASVSNASIKVCDIQHQSCSRMKMDFLGIVIVIV